MGPWNLLIFDDDDGGRGEVAVAATAIHATSVPVTVCIFSHLIISEQQMPAWRRLFLTSFNKYSKESSLEIKQLDQVSKENKEISLHSALDLPFSKTMLETRILHYAGIKADVYEDH